MIIYVYRESHLIIYYDNIMICIYCTHTVYMLIYSRCVSGCQNRPGGPQEVGGVGRTGNGVKATVSWTSRTRREPIHPYIIYIYIASRSLGSKVLGVMKDDLI